MGISIINVMDFLIFQTIFYFFLKTKREKQEFKKQNGVGVQIEE
jgi:hypothetical protein